MSLRAMNLLVLACAPALAWAADELPDVFEIGLEQLRNIRVVTASRQAEPLAKAPGTIQVVTREQIRERGYNNLLDVLRDLPGIDIHRYHYSILNDAVTWRGVYGNQKFVILQDGMRISSTTAEPLAIAENFPLYQVKQVEIVYGPASALYGADAFTGVVNIISQADMTGGEASVSVGQFGYRYGSMMTGARLGGGWHLALGAHLHESDDPDLAAQYPELFQLHDLVRANGSVAVPAGQRANFSSDRNSQSAYLSVTSASGVSLGFNHSRLNSETSRADVPDFLDYGAHPPWIVSVDNVYGRYRHALGARASTEVTLSYAGTEIDPASGFDNKLGDYGRVYKYAQSSALNLSQQLDWQFSEHHGLVAGYTLERVRSIPLTADLPQRYDVSRAPDNQAMYYPGTNGTLPIRIFRDDYRNAGLYAQLKSDWDTHWSTTLAVRRDHSTAYGNSTTPRVGLVYLPDEDDSYKLLFGEAFLTPSPYLTYRHFGGFSGKQDAQGRYLSSFFFLPNPDLRPETMKTVELHYGHQFSPAWRFDGSVYRERVHDFISQTFTPVPLADFIPGGIIGATKINANVGSLTATGADLSLSWEGDLGPGHARLWANYSYVDGTLTLLGKDGGLPLTARNKLKAGLSYQQGRLLLSPSVYAIGRTHSALGSDTGAASGYLLADLYAAWRDVVKGVDLFLNVYNVGDRKYYNPTLAGPPNSFAESPQPRRWFKAGLNARF